MELVAGNSPLLPTPEILVLETRIPYRLAEPAAPPRTSSALGCRVGRVLIPTTGHVESESLDAESRLRAQTT